MVRPRRALPPILAALMSVGGSALDLPASPVGGSAAPAQVSASVVLVTIDTVRADHLGCYGYGRIQTPAIDALAREGVRFHNAYAQVPLTLPSHAVILTGTYPMYNGVRDLTPQGNPVAVPTLAEILRRNGYQTAAFVSSFVLNSMWGLNRGFEVYDDATDAASGSNASASLPERRGDHTMDRALTWLNSHSGKPFFLWVHLYDPHTPYRPPEPFYSRYAGYPYDGEIAFDDAQVGRLVARLRRLGVYDGAMIAVAGDHGEGLGEHNEAEHGLFIYDSTLRVPLVLKFPGSAARPRVVDDPVGLVDLAPTIAEVCGIRPATRAAFQGRSLLNLMAPKRGNGVPSVYAESYYPRSSFGWHELRALITSQYKYIDAPTKELYDLKGDPGERHNLAATRSDAVVSLRESLESLVSANANTRAAKSSAQLDSDALSKLRSLGYFGHQAPAPRGSYVNGADPKDKIKTFNQLLQAENLSSVHRFEEAEGVLKDLERSEPDLYIVPFARGENLLNWGKAQAAVGEIQRALALNPSFDQAWAAMGRAKFAFGQNKKAADDLQAALRLNQRNYLARRLLARVYWRENQPQQAESELARVVRDQPNFGEARAEHGVALVRLKQYRQALPELLAAPELGYRDAIIYYYLGIAYGATGDARQSIKAYRKAIELDPEYAAAYLNLALQYRKGHEDSKALENYRKCCQFSVALCRQYAPRFR